jgi:hypothetical protein
VVHAVPVQLSTFLLADHAEAVNGKLYVVGGGFNRITAEQFPATHNHLSVAAVIHVPWDATNQPHTLELRLIDADGAPLIPEPLRASFEAGRPPGLRTGDEQLVVMVFNFNGLQFGQPGMYEFHLLVDDAEMGRLGFAVVRPEGSA